MLFVGSQKKIPGNKSSGRKSGVAEETDSICDESLKPQEKRKVGQPQGETTTPILISILPANKDENKEPPQNNLQIGSLLQEFQLMLWS